MTYQWPTREEWEADAEQFERTSCYPHQRVSGNLTDYATPDEVADLADSAKAARLALSRLLRSIDAGSATVSDTARAGHLVWCCLRRLQEVEARRDAAAAEATEAAVAEEVALRHSDAGWEAELRRRARIDRGPVVVLR